MKTDELAKNLGVSKQAVTKAVRAGRLRQSVVRVQDRSFHFVWPDVLREWVRNSDSTRLSGPALEHFFVLEQRAAGLVPRSVLTPRPDAGHAHKTAEENRLLMREHLVKYRRIRGLLKGQLTTEERLFLLNAFRKSLRAD